MAKYSRKERLIASVLSATPGLKKIVKRWYVKANALIYRKDYLYKIINGKILTIETPNEGKETFGGYYDRPTIKNGWILSHVTEADTSKLPTPQQTVRLVATDLNTREVVNIADTTSYNWQQGCRPQWLTDHLIVYNTFEGGRYTANVYSLTDKKIVRQFLLPVQDAYQTDYFLSINYVRLMEMNPDYCYRNLPFEKKDDKGDGIWRTDYGTGQSTLVHSIQSIMDFEHKEMFDDCQHIVNHVMISPDGSKFIFIHRYYQGHRRFDRLLVSDFHSLRILADEGMVSHCHWTDNDHIIGYLRHDGKNGFYLCNVNDGTIESIQEMNGISFGDGHPTCHGDWIAFDTYPDKSCMQHLFLFNSKSRAVIPILEVYHAPKFREESRCDLHPRFSDDGSLISFDTVFKGHRTQCFISIKDIVS